MKLIGNPIANRKDLSENEVLELVVAKPKLIERPIITNIKSGVLGRPLEKLKDFLKKH
jgi:arsenate reductase